jgi:hypothetical protein
VHSISRILAGRDGCCVETGRLSTNSRCCANRDESGRWESVVSLVG